MKERPNFKLIGESERPLICTPLIGDSRQALLDELSGILQKSPDIIEWRADFFKSIADTQTVIDMARELKKAAGKVPFIFTIRSANEGGRPIPLTTKETIELNAALCRDAQFEYVDLELRNSSEDIGYLREVAHEHNVKIIASFHDFERTPSKEALKEKFAQAANYKLDVAKIAVMPNNMEDVLTLLSATLESKAKLGIPLIAMSMGGYGAITRLVGGKFGSALTFAVGQNASAPGQIPIEDLRTALDIIEKAN